jgi:hypothetical protein
MPAPSKDALERTRLFKHWSVLEFCLKRWPQEFSNALKGKQTLELDNVEIIAQKRFTELLAWDLAARFAGILSINAAPAWE